MSWPAWIASNIALASLVGAAAWFVERQLHRPSVAHALWLLALVKLVTPPLVSIPLGSASLGGVLSAGASSGIACALGTCGCPDHAWGAGPALGVISWTLLAVWLTGVFATGLLAWRRRSQFELLVAGAPPAPAAIQSRTECLSRELSLPHAPAVLLAPGRLPPLVISGWRRPRLIVPKDLLSRLTDAQRDAMLLHELAHLRRGDHLVRLLEMVVTTAYWWLPAVGWIGRRLRDCEEACCDAAVVAHLPQARTDYARLLLDVVDFAHPPAVSLTPQATAMSAARGLERRLLTILRKERAPAGFPGAFAVVLGLALFVLPAGLTFPASARPVLAPVEPNPLITAAPIWSADEFAVFCCPK